MQNEVINHYLLIIFASINKGINIIHDVYSTAVCKTP